MTTQRLTAAAALHLGIPMTDTTRDAFEAWFTGPIGTNFLIKKDGEYTLMSAQTSWLGWQAATEQGKRQPLSDERIYEIGANGFGLPCRMSDFARAIEAAHGITATPPQGKI